MQTLENKQIWNEAVKKTLREVKKFDGVITEQRDREYIEATLTEQLCYKIKTNNNAKH